YVGSASSRALGLRGPGPGGCRTPGVMRSWPQAISWPAGAQGWSVARRARTVSQDSPSVAGRGGRGRAVCSPRARGGTSRWPVATGTPSSSRDQSKPRGDRSGKAGGWGRRKGTRGLLSPGEGWDLEVAGGHGNALFLQGPVEAQVGQIAEGVQVGDPDAAVGVGGDADRLDHLLQLMQAGGGGGVGGKQGRGSKM